MTSDSKKYLVSQLNISPTDSNFVQNVFSLLAKNRKKNEHNLKNIILEEFVDLSHSLDRSKIQESCTVRNVILTRNLASMLIDEKGELQLPLVVESIQILQNHLYSFGPGRLFDIRRYEHVLKVLTFLNENQEAQRMLRNISKPHANRQAEEIVRITLDVPLSIQINDSHVRIAALSAWLCYLRQNVGSCFATAPAIIVHDEQPLRFLNDLNELISTGRLKRTFEGIEYSVPFSKSWGAGDLKKNFLISGGEAFESFELWLSPGLLKAFEASGLITPEHTFQDKCDQLKTILKNHFQFTLNNYVITNAEEIIKLVLLKSLNLNLQDLNDYLNRPKDLPNPLLTSIPSSSNKTSHCQQFLDRFEKAKNAFKILTENPLLKTWEFSLASFAETKAQFTKWNLYSSLGLGPQDQGGIGPCMYHIFQRKLDLCNIRVQEIQQEYEQLYTHVKYLEVRLKRASTEKEVQWMKAEYQSNINELNTLQEIRDREHYKAQKIANLFDVLVNAYYELFPRYFQEVYDADMHEVMVGPYDDSPAGFRLLYKHGRTNSSQWTYIHNAQEFISSLSSFFIATEIEIAAMEELNGLQQELTDIVTAIITHLKTEEFLESAFYRMAAAHNTPLIENPLQNLDKIEKKPWAYTSGGTMGSLVSCYFKLPHQPSEVGRWVENPMELLVFLIDSLKHIPPKTIENFIKDERKSLLIHSPTHAFLLKPFYPSFFEAWQNDFFTYTWARDHLILPIERAVDMIHLDQEMMDYIVRQLLPQVSPSHRHYFRRAFGTVYSEMTPSEFRRHLVETMESDPGLQVNNNPIVSADEIDSLLLRVLPLFPLEKIRERIEETFSNIKRFNETSLGYILELWDSLPVFYGGEKIGNAEILRDICISLWALYENKTSISINIHEEVAQAMRTCGFLLPRPVSVADSNWVKDDFGFVYNPGNSKVELWKLDPLGTSGSPMSLWQQWLNGSRKDRTWGIYNQPYEYL